MYFPNNSKNYPPQFESYSKINWPNQYEYIRQQQQPIQPISPIQAQRLLQRITGLENYIIQMNQRILKLEQTTELHTMRLNSLNERLKTVEKTLTIIPESEA